MLSRRRFRAPVVVLGLPRGGVPVAFEVARALHAPLDVLTVRKIGMPEQPELAIGAIAPGGVIVRESSADRFHRLETRQFDALAERERPELERRERVYRAGRPALDLKATTVVLVDDGLATGATMLAAIRAARKAGAATVVAAAPVASDEGAALVGGEADDVAFLEVPAFMGSVGEWYRDFAQVGDHEVCELLAKSRVRSEQPSSS